MNEERELYIIATFFFSVIAIYGLSFMVCFRMVLKKFSIINPEKKVIIEKHPVRWTILGLTFLGTLCILYGAFVEPHWVEITRNKFNSKKLQKGQKIKIVHLSDLHFAGNKNIEHTLADKVNALNPDIILMTGDYLNSFNANSLLAQQLKAMRAKYGIYAVIGNYCKIYPATDILTQSGVKVLDIPEIHNSTRKIDLTINDIPVSIYGYHTDHSEMLSKDIGKLDKNRYNILLFHYPGFIEDVKDKGFDLYLSGHTHGGQVRLPFYGALVTYGKHGKKYEMGRYKVNDTNLYVSRGYGMEGFSNAPKVRFLCRPEIAVHEIVGE